MADHRVKYQRHQPEATNLSVNTYPGPGPRTHPVHPHTHGHAQRVAVSHSTHSHCIAYQFFLILSIPKNPHVADRPDTVQQGADWQGVPHPAANLAMPGEIHNEPLHYNAA